MFYGSSHYWAISPYNDLTATLRVHETVNPLIGLDYRQRFWSGEVNINATITSEQLFDSEGDRFGAENGPSVFDGRFRINDYWRWGFGLERVTDDDYLRRYDVQGAGEERGPYIGNENRLLSQLFAIGQNRNSYSSIAFASIQGLRAADTPDLLAHHRPLRRNRTRFHRPASARQVRFQTNLALLERDDNPPPARSRAIPAASRSAPRGARI